MAILKLVQLNEREVGLVLPSDLLTGLEWTAGDFVLLTEVAGGISLSTPTAQFKEQIDAGLKVIRARRNVLRALAASDTSGKI